MQINYKHIKEVARQTNISRVDKFALQMQKWVMHEQQCRLGSGKSWYSKMCAVEAYNVWKKHFRTVQIMKKYHSWA